MKYIFLKVLAIYKTQDVALAAKSLGMPIDIYEEKLDKYGIKPLGFTM